MSRLSIILSILLILASTSFSQRPRGEGRRVSGREPAADSRKVMIKADTIPLNKRFVYRLDNAKFKRYQALARKDSTKLQLADTTDWKDFSKIHSKLKATIEKDEHQNVQNYIDTAAELSELQLVNPEFAKFTAKVCLRQLIFNLKLLDQLLNRQLDEEADVELLSMIMQNIDTLITKYILTFGNRELAKSIISPTVIFKVFDSSGVEITNAKCYLITPKTCRDIVCKSCMPAKLPCEESLIGQIVSKNDKVYDCANPVPVPVYYGRYHIYVVNGNKVLFYEMRQIDQTTIDPSNKLINIRFN
jgi:hypothetical protein